MQSIFANRFSNRYILPLVVLLVIASCCGGKLPDLIEPNLAPVAALDAVAAMESSQIPDVVGDAPLAIFLDASDSFDPDGAIVSYDWDFETDGTYDLLDGGATTTHIYETAGLYTATVRVTDNGGLSATATALISVGTAIPPEAVGSGSIGEDPLEVTYDATASVDLDGEIVQYDWDMDGDGVFEIIDGEPNPVHTFPTYGTHTVNFRVTDDDGQQDEGEIVVTLVNNENLAPNAILTATPDSGFAPGLEITYDAALSTDVDGTIVSYDWDMDNNGFFEIIDGGSFQIITYDTEGGYTVGVRVTDDDGATDTDDTQVIVGLLMPPRARLIATPDSGLAPGLDVTFDATASSDVDGYIVSYDWDMDNDGTFEILDSDPQQYVTYDEEGVYTTRVRVTDNDNSTDTAEASVTVGAIVPPVADVTATPDNGDAPLDVVFDATGSTDADGTIVRYDWDMNNDGTFEVINSSATQNANYQKGGQYIVVVKVTDNDGASDTASVSVDVNIAPTAILIPTPDSGDAPLQVSWDASSSFDSDGTVVQFDWDMDNDGTFEISDGGTIQIGGYEGGGSYTVGVQVTDDDGATGSTTATVEINNPPVAHIAIYSPPGTAPDEIIYDASLSSDSDGTIVQYDWDMDFDGTFEITAGNTIQTALYSVGGDYTVAVRVTDDDGATATTSKMINVNNAPTAAIEASPASGAVPFDTTFDASGSTDSDGTIVRYDWDMDNDGTFEIMDGGVTQPASYEMDGIYTVTVRVTDDDFASSTASETVTVLTPPTAVLEGEFDGEWQIYWDASGSYDTGGGSIVTYDWDTNDDGTFDLLDQGPTYTMQGVEYYESYTVGVRVTDDDGLTDSTYTLVFTDYGGEE